MNCPHCQSSSTTEREGRTVHGFRRFRFWDYGRRFNERTGTALNRVQVPTDIVFLVVFWRLRYKLSLRDLAEMFLLHVFIDFCQLCSSKPTAHVHGNRTAVFMISTTCFRAGQHTFKAS